MARKLRIQSDGTPMGTKVVDAFTKEQIQGCTFVSFEHRAGEFPKAVIEVFDPEVDLLLQYDSFDKETATNLKLRKVK